MTLLKNQDETVDAKMADLVETYNTLTGKSIKKFESIEVGRARVCNAMLVAQDAAGHAGVPKGTDPAKLEMPAIVAGTTKPQPTEKEPEMATTKKKPAAKKAAPAKKTKPTPKAAKKPTPKASKPAAKASGRVVYTRVRLSEPATPRRPQANSKRSVVLAALRKRKEATLDQLSTDVGFDVRAYMHKLVEVGWAEIVSAK